MPTGETGTLQQLLYGLSDTITFLFATPIGLAVVGTTLTCVLAFRVYNSIRARSLACAAAGGSLKAGESFAVFFDEAARIFAWVLGNLPALIAVIVVFTSVVGVTETLRKFDAVAENQKRITQLSKVVQNLDRRYRVADARVVSQLDGVTTLEFTMFASGNAEKPARTQTLSLKGKDIFIDAVVCNFAFSDIENGKSMNLAIPYRVFSEELPQASGKALEINDARGIPYQYGRDDDGVYGISKENFDLRLRELVGIMSGNDESREFGIVRSVYGSAVHKIVKSGDRFTIWVEQTGGLTIKDVTGF